ncbi:MAG: HIT family protein [Candidatus Woesearchaeota archaeon]
MTCPICDMIDDDKFVVYQDKLAVALLVPNPASEGHIAVVPREHHAILEQVPDNVVSHMFIIANRVSRAVFEMLGAQGTNITVNNGIPAGQASPHVMVNIIPRKEDDGIDFMWIPSQPGPEEMRALATKIKDKCDYIGHEVIKEKPLDLDKKSEIKQAAEEIDYRIKQLERVP